jgi:alpha-galactosidase
VIRIRPRTARRALAALATGALVISMSVVGTDVAQAQTAGPGQHQPDMLGATPQMGWNDWNAFGCDVDAQLVEQTADTMVANGMQAAGYEYVNIDDCWLAQERDADGNLVPDPVKFPDGIKAVADYVHSKGLKLGIYNSAGTETCAGYPGSLGHEKQDAALWASWGVDYLKYDNCNNQGSSTRQEYIDRYTAMADAIKATGRPMFYSLCEWGVNDPWTWAGQIGQSWRTTGDIRDSYDSMLSIFNQNVWLYPYAGPGGWNDPDMLEVGNGGMTTAEYQTEFSPWAEMAAPLLAGTDLRTMSDADLAIYTNKDVIAVDQDPLGKQGVPIAAGGKPAGNDGLWVMSKPLQNGDRAVLLFNSTGTTRTITTTAAEVGMARAGDYTLDNLWTHAKIETAGMIGASVPAHGVVMYRVSDRTPRDVAPDVMVTMDGLNAVAAAGQASEVTVGLTNHGAQSVTDVSVSVQVPTGWHAEATSPTDFSSIRSGRTVTATFAVTPGAPTAPLDTATVVATASYRWGHGQQASASASQSAIVNAPVSEPNQTFSSADDAPARFGQVGDDFAISGAGSDLWGSHDNYSTIYRTGVVGTSSTVQTEVTALSGLSGFGKAGILVRNVMTDAGQAPEGVILFVSPDGGIQVEWNSNSDASIDSVTPENGTIDPTVPVHLKLVRDGSTYTGYYSSDGSTWQQVGSATVPGQADTQDAGLFITSHSTGSPAQADFSGFTVS